MVFDYNYTYTYNFRVSLFLLLKMMNKKNSSVFVIILFLLTISIGAAFFIEYVLGHEPCKLCIYQRYPYIISILLLISILMIKKKIKIHLLLLSIISLIGAIIAFYHFGIEQGFFSESAVCEARNLNQFSSKEELIEKLKQNTISCKEVTFRFLGLSLASINTIFSLALSCIFLLIFKNYENNR